MSVCRTCLNTPADKHVSDLEEDIKDGSKDCSDIMKFCLDIEIMQHPKITTNLCSECYRKIISFYKFKIVCLKNDSYLKSLDPIVQLELLEDYKISQISVYVDENGIKHENHLDIDDVGPSLVEEIKKETDFTNDDLLGGLEADIKNEDTLPDLGTDDEPLCDVQKVEYENIKDHTKKKVYKKHYRLKKVKSTKEKKLIRERKVCEECGKSVRNIKEHSLLHQPQEQRQKVQCKACPKVFATSGGRNTHYKFVHLGIKPTCDICNKVVRNLKVHKLQVHNPAALRFSCVLCERRYVSQFALDLHMLAHTKDPKFECDICQKKFRLKNHVSNHIRKIHVNEKNYQCDVCAKAFFDKKGLQLHSRSHSKERLYKCEECGLALKTKATFKFHRMTHGQDTYHCQLCSKSFKRADYLRVHMVTHTKDKRYECRYCGARFGRSHHRSRHEHTAHKKHLEAE